MSCFIILALLVFSMHGLDQFFLLSLLKLQDYGKNPPGETEVQFRLTKVTLEPMLRSMAYISQQLSTPANRVAVINLKVHGHFYYSPTFVETWSYTKVIFYLSDRNLVMFYQSMVLSFLSRLLNQV